MRKRVRDLVWKRKKNIKCQKTPKIFNFASSIIVKQWSRFYLFIFIFSFMCIIWSGKIWPQHLMNLENYTYNHKQAAIICIRSAGNKIKRDNIKNLKEWWPQFSKSQTRNTYSKSISIPPKMTRILTNCVVFSPCWSRGKNHNFRHIWFYFQLPLFFFPHNFSVAYLVQQCRTTFFMAQSKTFVG